MTSDEGASGKRAPGRLALVQSFVNSDHDGIGGSDVLDDAASSAGWLADHGYSRVATHAKARARLRELREALRTTMLSHTGLVDREVAAAALAPVCAGASLEVVIGAGAAPQVAGAGGGIDRFVNDVLAAVTIAAIDGSWERAKACSEPDCRRAFWDATKNHAGRFCSSAGCANRARQRQFRARQRAASGG